MDFCYDGGNENGVKIKTGEEHTGVGRRKIQLALERIR